jgi:hypothetical protein
MGAAPPPISCYSLHNFPNGNPCRKYIFQLLFQFLRRFKNRFPLNQNLWSAVDVDDGTLKQPNLSSVLNRLRLQNVESVFPKSVLNDFCEHYLFP